MASRSRQVYLLALALMVGVLLAASGAAVGQQGQAPPRKVRSPQQSRGARPSQTRARKGNQCPQSWSLGSTKV